VRGAIDLALVAGQLLDLDTERPVDSAARADGSTGDEGEDGEKAYRETVYDAMIVALGPDPRPFAARLPRLDVLLDATGEQDPWLGGELARLGRGKLRVAGTYRDIAPALSSFFAQ
jgi:hypothetical protein